MERRRMLLMMQNINRNLFDMDTMFTDMTPGYLKQDGSIGSSSAWYISDYIPVNGDSFVLKNVGGNVTSIVLYDANKQYLNGKSYSTGDSQIKADVYITSSQTTSYIRFSAYGSSIDALKRYLMNVELMYY